MNTKPMNFKTALAGLFVIFSLFFLAGSLFAKHSSADPSPLPSVIAVLQGQVDSGAAVDSITFLGDVLQAGKEMGGVPWVIKISILILILIASMKVSFFDDLIWNKLKGAKAFAAPLLGMVSGILILAYSGHFSLAGVFAYMGAGSGALALHELLDAVKAIPGLGSVYVNIINAVESRLGGNPK